MASGNNDDLVSELNTILKDASNPAANIENSAKDELPMESMNDFSTENMTFPEITALIMEQTEDVFALTARYNRHSSQYRKACKTLEKAVTHLGSAFITKTALLQKKYKAEGLEMLTAERLHQMISFNVRKCSAALNEIKQTRHEFDWDLFDMLLSMDSTMARLRATQKKAQEINSWLAEPYKTAVTSLSFTEKDSGRETISRQSVTGPFRNKPSFELMRDVLTAYADAETSCSVSGNDIRTSEEGEHPKMKNDLSFSQTEKVNKSDISISAPEDPFFNKKNNEKYPDVFPEKHITQTADDRSITEKCECSDQHQRSAAGSLPILPKEKEKENSTRSEEISSQKEEPAVSDDDTDPMLESKIRFILSLHPEGYREILYHLEDPCYCQERPEYVKIFRKILSEREKRRRGSPGS